MAQEVLENYKLGRKVLVLIEQTEHLDDFQVALLPEVPDIFLLHGQFKLLEHWLRLF